MKYNLDLTTIEGDLQYIDNFLTQEELDFFKPYMDDHEGWYTTMRSPYKNILNKFISVDLPRRPDGSTGVPSDEPPILHDVFHRPMGIYERLFKVMPPTYRPHNALQTFKYCTDEEILRDLHPDLKKEYKGKEHEIDFAMSFHCEWSDESTVPEFNRSLSIYLNDDFEGGILDFKFKPYKIKPKAGMLVLVPVTHEFTHRVTKITSGNWRHTLYGASWNGKFPPPSTEETC
jgi:hypothetical protein